MIKSVKPCGTTGQNLVGLWRPSFTRVDQKLYLYGGGGHVTNDLHVLDLVTMNWDCVLVSKLLLFFFFLNFLVHHCLRVTRAPATKKKASTRFLLAFSPNIHKTKKIKGWNDS